MERVGEIEEFNDESELSRTINETELEKLVADLEKEVQSKTQSKEKTKPTEVGSQSSKAAAPEKKQSDNRPFAEKYPRLNAIKDWLFTSRIVPTTLQLELQQGKLQNRDKKYADPAYKVIGFHAVEDAFKESMGGKESNFIDTLKAMFLRANGIDGYNHFDQTLTCADGTTVKFGPRDLTWKMILLSLLALPTRPETVVTVKVHGHNRYIPQISALQMLRNLIGGYVPLHEKVTGTNDMGEKASFYKKWRWTQKKGFILAFSVIRVPLFVAFNLVTYPFRLARNLLRTVAEVIIPFLSLMLMRINGIFNDFFTGTITAIGKSIENDNEKGVSPWIALQIPGAIFFGALSLALVVAQYAMSLLCRAGLALSSPLKSAWLAYNSGVLILGAAKSTSVVSRVVGWLGFGLSLTLSVTLWAIALPLTLGALVNAIPALLTPITTLSQSPFIANVLAWLTRLPFLTGAASAFHTAFGVVGAALAATFGKAILGLGAIFSVAIPEVVVVLSLVVSIVVMPVASFITWGVEVISNAFMRWVEQSPFSNLFSKPKEGAGMSAAKGAQNAKQAGAPPQSVRVHQPENGGMIIVGPAVTRLVTESEDAKVAAERAIVSSLLVDDETQVRLLFDKAKAGNGYRAVTQVEFRSTAEAPAVVADNGAVYTVPL